MKVRKRHKRSNAKALAALLAEEAARRAAVTTYRIKAVRGIDTRTVDPQGPVLA